MGLRDWLGLKRKKSPRTEAANCAFCGRAAAEVEKLIAGPALFICDECVERHSEMVAREEARVAARPDHCSFCSRTRRKVRAIVGDENASICDQCLGLCRDILAEELRRG